MFGRPLLDVFAPPDAATADDLTTAARVARVIARSLSFHHLVECDEATVAAVDHPAFCPGQLPNGRRCLLRPDHDGECTRRLPR
ncbi:hypothetical protein [Micromonospora echinospora]|uniref:hypothetical protein n=1 Tax=Micromonospora echinospora TaxID=1877 RepID=UPI00366FC19A